MRAAERALFVDGEARQLRDLAQVRRKRAAIVAAVAVHASTRRRAYYFCGFELSRVFGGVGGCARDQIGRRRFDERGATRRCSQSSMPRAISLLDVLHELVDLALHLLDLPAHVEDDLDAGEVDAEIAGQRQNRFELLEVLFRVEARVAVGARRLQQPFALVQAQRLRVDVVSSAPPR